MCVKERTWSNVKQEGSRKGRDKSTRKLQEETSFGELEGENTAGEVNKKRDVREENKVREGRDIQGFTRQPIALSLHVKQYVTTNNDDEYCTVTPRDMKPRYVDVGQ